MNLRQTPTAMNLSHGGQTYERLMHHTMRTFEVEPGARVPGCLNPETGEILCSDDDRTPRLVSVTEQGPGLSVQFLFLEALND